MYCVVFLAGVLVSVPQRNRTNRVYMYIFMYKEIYYKELANVIIEAEKSQDLQLASRRLGLRLELIPSALWLLRLSVQA